MKKRKKGTERKDERVKKTMLKDGGNDKKRLK